MTALAMKKEKTKNDCFYFMMIINTQYVYFTVFTARNVGPYTLKKIKNINK